MTVGVGDDDARTERRELSPREVVEQRLDPGEPIEAFLRLAARGPAPDARAGGLLTGTATVTFAGAAARHMVRESTIAVTDRRVFFVSGPMPHEVRVVPRRAVRVLSYETSGSWIRLWLNVDGQQAGYVIGQDLRAPADALVHALETVPPSHVSE